MRRVRIVVAGVVCVVSALALTEARQSSPAHPWPPGVLAVPSQSPARSPADELQTFYMPPGYHAELVASEPLVEDPILIDWDADGRMWVIELPSYMEEINPSNERERQPTGRIVVLEDTNHDGKMDKRTVFMDGLVQPRALKVLEHGVLVGEPPNLWFVHDRGDLHAGTKDLVTDTYGRLDASVEHNANSLTWGLDNWLHTSEIDVFLRWKAGKFEVRKTLSRGQWGVTQDDAGRMYRNTNESVLHVDIVPTPYFARNPNLLRQRGSYESLEGDNDEVSAVFPVRPTPGVNRGYTLGILRADQTLARYTSVHSPTVYRGDRLPADLRGNVFVGEPAGNTVSRIIVNDEGGTLKAHRAYDRAEFLSSTDERFRPVYLSSAPDGALYVVDMYRGIIQHRNYITEYLRDQILSRDLVLPIRRGRIYRLVHDTTRLGPAPALSKATTAQLVQELAHPNGWWRDTAQRLLVERGDKAVVVPLTRLAAMAPDPRTRMHALWTLDGMDAITPAVVVNALADANRDVRTSAVRLSERWLAEPNAAVQAALLKRIDDADWSVQRQLAASLGELPKGSREAPLATLLERHADDPMTLDAAMSGLRGSEGNVMERLLQGAQQTPQREAALTMIAALIMRGAQDADVQSVFLRVAEASRPAWQRSALLRGVEVVVTGAALPGPVAGRGRGAAVPDAAAPCPTCPGARGGPGGASAFGNGGGPAGGARAAGAAAPAAPAAGAGAGRGGRGGGGPIVRVNREPAALSGLAAGTSEFAPRATAVLARIEWPGKPGATAPVTPLTAEEQQRFAAGHEVYQSVCMACHQDDGRGKEKVAPSLVGSALATGPAAITARILMNGKEGPIGLMPPLGQAFSDDQVAAVLTYVRRQWGNTATPVDVATAKEARAAGATRTRPWTNDELAALAAGGGSGRP